MEHTNSLVYLVLLLAAAKIGGELVESVRLPAVLGELLAGVVLGLAGVRHLTEDPAIGLIAAVGIVLLLFETGLESELEELASAWVSASLVAVIGVVLPLAAGFGAMSIIHGDYKVALFIGATLTATSVAITVRVLSDAGKLESKEARIILGAAVIDDILGLLLLSVVLQISSGGTADVLGLARTVFIALAFLVTATWAGVRYASRLVPLAQRLKTRGILVSIAFIFCMAMAVAAREFGLAEIVGAFAAGLVLATTEDRVRIREQIKPLAHVFVPVFFALVGLRIDLSALNPFDPQTRPTALMGLLLFALAVVSKVAAGLGVRDRSVDKLSVGVGMVPRGEVVLIFATIGLTSGILSAAIYAELVEVVFLSTLIAPWWLGRVLQRRQDRVSDQEAMR